MITHVAEGRRAEVTGGLLKPSWQARKASGFAENALDFFDANPSSLVSP
jgi:hypothetical protein